MGMEDFKILSATDLSIEDKWNILYNYMDFSCRAMSLMAFLHKSNDKDYVKYTASAALCCTIRQLMVDDKALLKMVTEMQDPANEIVRQFPTHYDDNL